MKIVHGSPGFGSMLTEEQTIEFLTDKKLIFYLVLLARTVIRSYILYGFCMKTKKLYVETSKTSKKVQNIQQKNMVYFCIDDENLPYRGVRGKSFGKNIN